jgi:hypothetical protein
MAQHQLSLNIPDIVNEYVIKIEDTSAYNSIVPIDCPLLQITPPGFVSNAQFDNLTVGFNKIFTACDIGLQTINCGIKNSVLPDGIYIIKWSVAPNNIVYVEYNHLRITQALIKYHKMLCDLVEGACEPSAENKKKIKELQYIRTLLDAAKAKVEYCHEAKKGMELYNYAIKLLGMQKCSKC